MYRKVIEHLSSISIRRMFKGIAWIYEAHVAPFLATKARFLYWPLYKYCKYKNICFVMNIAGGIGHIIAELDFFFRRLEMSILDKNKRYVWISKNYECSKVCTRLYKSQFYHTSSNLLIYYFLLPLMMAYKDITVDAGLSRLKWQLENPKKYPKPRFKENHLYQISKLEGFSKWEEYFQLRNASKNFFPLINCSFFSTIDHLLDKSKKLALIHIKDSICNATAIPTDPKTYLPTLEFLLIHNYQLIFVGREKMPEIFKEFAVINYANSPLANFEHDIYLAKVSDIMISGGSGIGYIPDCLGNYYLFLNSWHLPLPQPSDRAIFIPSLVADKSKNFLSFTDQLKLYADMRDEGEEVFPSHSYVARNATQEEIFEATLELLSLKEKDEGLTDRQQKFKELGKDYPSYYTNSRPSDYFLKSHEELLR